MVLYGNNTNTCFVKLRGKEGAVNSAAKNFRFVAQTWMRLGVRKRGEKEHHRQCDLPRENKEYLYFMGAADDNTEGG